MLPCMHACRGAYLSQLFACLPIRAPSISCPLTISRYLSITGHGSQRHKDNNSPPIRRNQNYGASSMGERLRSKIRSTTYYRGRGINRHLEAARLWLPARNETKSRAASGTLEAMHHD